MREQHGFTVVELMTVVAIVGVLGALAVAGVGDDGNPRRSADVVASVIELARARAIATGRSHRVEVAAHSMTTWQASTVGFGPPTEFERVQFDSILAPMVVWNATSAVILGTGNMPSEDATLLFAIDIKPDGSSTGGTIFITNEDRSDEYRVIVYRATGNAYPKESW